MKTKKERIMQELIPLQEHNGEKAVDARLLHEFLESKQQFSDWIKNRIKKYGFVENQDYVSFHNSMKRETGATTTIEYILSLDCAKELAMVEGNAKGKQARQYFIACEKKLKSKPSIEKISKSDLARMVLESEQEKEKMQLQLEEQRPAVLFRDAVSGSNTNISVGDLAKLLRQNGIDIGQNRLYQWLTEHKYLICRKRWSSRYNRHKNDYIPTQKAADLSVFFVEELPIVSPNGSFVKHTVKVTGKGQVYFINKFLKEVEA